MNIRLLSYALIGLTAVSLYWYVSYLQSDRDNLKLQNITINIELSKLKQVLDDQNSKILSLKADKDKVQELLNDSWTLENKYNKASKDKNLTNCESKIDAKLRIYFENL